MSRRTTYQVNGTGTFTIDVLDHRKLDPADYTKRAADAPLLQIKKGAPSSRKIEIVAGQSVVWLVDEESDVTIASISAGP
jgi:hypothetical protein